MQQIKVELFDDAFDNGDAGGEREGGPCPGCGARCSNKSSERGVGGGGTAGLCVNGALAGPAGSLAGWQLVEFCARETHKDGCTTKRFRDGVMHDDVRPTEVPRPIAYVERVGAKTRRVRKGWEVDSRALSV